MQFGAGSENLPRVRDLQPPLKRKRSKPLTTDSKHSNHVCKNILDRDFVTTGPNEKWLTDITYIRIKGKFVYLSAIIDLHSRRVISWIISRDYENPARC